MVEPRELVCVSDAKLVLLLLKEDEGPPTPTALYCCVTSGLGPNWLYAGILLNGG